MPKALLPAIPETSAPPHRGAFRQDFPVVFRAAAAGWPAVRDWSFARLAREVDDIEVRLVAGNRERHPTRFRTSSLRDYLLDLDRGRPVDEVGYLKEFDLRSRMPHLDPDLPHGDLLPRGGLGATRCWIGPARASTGLHYDHLPNIAVQVLGRKRWRIARPGAVERLGAVSSKYDAWATLSTASVDDLAPRGRPGDFYQVDLHPGDVLHLPARWWHEVVNLEASLFVGGFHGPALPVLGRWLWVNAREGMHRAGLIGRRHCTCHPSS